MSRIGSLLDALREVRVQGQRIADLERELLRLSPQVAALEQRLEDLRARIDDPAWEADDAQRAEARSLVDEVRAEHARVRARISASTVFEERLRVLEQRAGIDSATGRPVEG
ncbi:hypothetical protein [Marmoricola sp. RAF53]|uniref:hypothetical protein n=1 Tax=Marmoricola sp. RAF53 TaxID=3233059 RepID=UPI003F9AF898